MPVSKADCRAGSSLDWTDRRRAMVTTDVSAKNRPSLVSRTVGALLNEDTASVLAVTCTDGLGRSSSPARPLFRSRMAASSPLFPRDGPGVRLTTRALAADRTAERRVPDDWGVEFSYSHKSGWPRFPQVKHGSCLSHLTFRSRHGRHDLGFPRTPLRLCWRDLSKSLRVARSLFGVLGDWRGVDSMDCIRRLARLMKTVEVTRLQANVLMSRLDNSTLSAFCNSGERESLSTCRS